MSRNPKMQELTRDAMLPVTRSVRAIGAVFALSAFVVAILAGAASLNSASVVLLRAILAMVCCYPLGLVVGVIAQRAVQQHISDYIEANPLPEPSDDMEAGAGGDATDSPLSRDDENSSVMAV